MPVPEKLLTERLCLRQFSIQDALRVTTLLADPAIAAGVLEIPFPYTNDDAREWICRHASERDMGVGYTFAVCERNSGELAGAAGLRVNPAHSHAELGYWIGRPFRGRGYAREAASALLELGFFGLGLHRIYARHLAWNRASSRVLEGIGLVHEGTLRGHARKWGLFHDVEVYGICYDDFCREHWQKKGKAPVILWGREKDPE